MGRPKQDPIREARIHDQAIVDAYGSEEKAMSWYYYLEGKVQFPFRATCIAAKATSPLRKGDMVEVQRMASDKCLFPRDACTDPLAGTKDGRPSGATGRH